MEYIGKWKVKRPIQQRIFLVHTETDSTPYVLKREPSHSAKRIANLLKGCSHPNVLQLIDYSLNPEAYTVCNYCKLGTLRDFDFSGWTDRQKLDCCFQIFEGIEWIHSRGFNKHDNDSKNVFMAAGNVPVIGDLESLQQLTEGIHVKGAMSSIYTFFYKLMNERECLQELEKRNRQYEAGL